MEHPHYRRVKMMMAAFGQSTPSTPIIPNSKTRELRARLIFEECMETIRALGCCIKILDRDGGVGRILDGSDDFTAEQDGKPDMKEIVDGCADISVVTIGTLVACGVRDAALLKEVDENNLAKVRGGHTDEFGKFIKPKNHRPPNIEKVLTDQGWEFNNPNIEPEVETQEDAVARRLDDDEPTDPAAGQPY